VESGAKAVWERRAAVRGSCDSGVCGVGGSGCGSGGSAAAVVVVVVVVVGGSCGTAVGGGCGSGSGLEASAFVSWRVLWVLKQVREQLWGKGAVSEQV